MTEIMDKDKIIREALASAVEDYGRVAETAVRERLPYWEKRLTKKVKDGATFHKVNVQVKFLASYPTLKSPSERDGGDWPGVVLVDASYGAVWSDRPAWRHPLTEIEKEMFSYEIDI